MIIRCERCSTLYELEEGLLSPEGTEVQCARCQHVFTAVPPQASGQTVQGPPAQERPAPADTPPPPAAASPQAPAPAIDASMPPAAARAAHRPSVYRPMASQPSQPTVTRPAVLRRDTVGSFESRLRRSHRWRWLAPALLLALVGAGAGVVLLRRGSADDRARAAHAAALTLALADDIGSLEQARGELDRALAAAPDLDAARADRALVDLLLAGALAETAAPKAGPSPAQERSRALVGAATAALEALERGGAARPEVARARAVAASFGESRAELAEAVTVAAGLRPGDVWVAAAEAGAALRAPEPAARERAVAELGRLVARRPEALRARYLLALGYTGTGRRSEALATLEALLRVNPRHEAAAELRASMLRLPASAPVAHPAPPPAASAPAAGLEGEAEKPAALPRKPDSTGGELSGAPPDEGRVGAAPGTAPARPPGDTEPGQGEVPAAAGAEPAPGLEPAPAPRLRPAAVPEPEPIGVGD